VLKTASRAGCSWFLTSAYLNYLFPVGHLKKGLWGSALRRSKKWVCVQGSVGFSQPQFAQERPGGAAAGGLQGCRNYDRFSPQAWRGDDGARQVQPTPPGLRRPIMVHPIASASSTFQPTSFGPSTRCSH